MKPRSASIHPGPGFRIRQETPKLPWKLMNRFRDFEVTDISDQLNRFYSLDPAIACQTRSANQLCGPACTVSVFPGDNLMVHKVLDVAMPGDIVVVDANGLRTGNAVLGDIICTKAKHRGIAGFVIDGLVRDMPAIEDLDFPVFARGTTAIGPLHRGPGEINYPISCGGKVVNPGDMIVADQSGIVTIPMDSAEETLGRLEKQRQRQEQYLKNVREGKFSNEWVDQILQESGCFPEGDDTEISNRIEPMHHIQPVAPAIVDYPQE